MISAIKYVLILMMLIPLPLLGQTDSTEKRLQLSGYVDVYFGHEPGTGRIFKRPDFIYSYNVNNEINMNLGFVKANYVTQKVRLNLAMMAGTYVNSNLASEKGIAKNILEASVGLKLSKKHNLWLDAGVFPSHIGYESAIGKDCYNLTRSIMADNTPYYETGIKLGWISKSGKWIVNGLLLNGWQKIYQDKKELTPAFGTQIQFAPNNRVLLNYGTFFGNIEPEAGLKHRKFHDIYGQFKIKKSNTLILGVNIGNQTFGDTITSKEGWYAVSMVFNHAFKNKWSSAARLEYFNDPSMIFAQSKILAPFECTAYSINADYHHTSNIIWRIEYRFFNNTESLLRSESTYNKKMSLITTSIAVSF